MNDINKDEILEKFPYLKNNEIQVETCMVNDNTICVLLNIKMKDLITIVDNFGWECVFDRGIQEEQCVFTCIAKVVQ